jgi:magnesium-protoporphyrin O-methyltransferase
MTACCNSRGCDQMFDERFAERAARRYRERGLDRNARRIVEFLEQRGIEGATVLEIGGGVGEIHIELLRRGALHVVNLELSQAYDGAAAQLLGELDLASRVERRVCDLAVDGDSVAPADVVVLHRVVCCYPDYERLLTAVARHAGQAVVFSHPPRNPVSRLYVGAANLKLRLQRREFRAFVHPPRALLAVLERNGLDRTFARRGVVWHVAGMERQAAVAPSKNPA